MFTTLEGCGGLFVMVDEPDVRRRAAALERLVDLHGVQVESVLVFLERDAGRREDLWSDVFEVAYRRVDELAELPDGQARAWLLRTARYLGANAARRGATARRLVERLAREPFQAAWSSAEDVFFERSRRVVDERTIRAALAAMTVEERELLTMHAIGLNGPAIARALGVTDQAARSRLMRARQALAAAHASLESGMDPEVERR